MRTAARVDDNQKEIVAEFRRLGFSVLLTHQLGSGAPDCVVGLHGTNYLVEIKDGSKPPSAQKLTPDEEKFHAGWKGSICIVRDLEDVAWVARLMTLSSTLH